MTTPKALTVHKGGSRYYIRPGSEEKFPGVTSICGMLPKGFLKAWAAKMVAEAAVRATGRSGIYTDSKGNRFDLATEPDWLGPMIDADPHGAVDFLKRAADRSTKKAADIGTAAHGIFERMLLGETVGALTEDLEPFRRQFADLLDTVQPEALYTEETVWSEAHGYAGSFDAIVRVQGETCIADAKTTASGVYPEVALQLSAYAHAEYMLDDDSGEQLILPKITRGLVFHVRPEAWAVYEVPIGDEVFEYFLALRKIFTWDAQIARQIVGRPTVKGAVAA